MHYRNTYQIDGLKISGGLVKVSYRYHFLAVLVLFVLTLLTTN